MKTVPLELRANFTPAEILQMHGEYQALRTAVLDFIDQLQERMGEDFLPSLKMDALHKALHGS